MKRPLGNPAVFVVAGALTAILLGHLPARAQETGGAAPSSIGQAMSVEEIRWCLCDKGDLAAKRQQLERQRGELAGREQELATLQSQIERTRATMNPSDTVSQEVLKGLIHQQVALRGLVQSVLRPGLARSVAELAAAVDQYNGQCAGKVQFAADIAAAQRDLQCQAP